MCIAFDLATIIIHVHVHMYSQGASGSPLVNLWCPVLFVNFVYNNYIECLKFRYEYIVCPFQNVTQKEERSSWNNFHGVLG